MEQNIADFSKSAFPETDFEHVHFDDDFKTTRSDGTPQRQTAMVDNHNYRDTSEPLAMSALDLPQIPSSTNANEEEERKNCSENNEDCLLDEQSMKMGSMVYNSWDDNNSIENKTQVQQQQINVCDEESRESEFKMHAETSDLHQIENKQDQTEDVSLLELVPTKGTHHDLGAEYKMVMEKTTSDLMSCQMLDKFKNSVDPEHVFQYAMNDNNFSAIESELHDCPIVSTEDESEDEINFFTEDDHVKKGLADYPSDLSESVNEGNSESHSIPTDISKQSEMLVVHRFHEIENLATTSTHDDIQKESSMDPQDMATLKNEELAVEAISSKYDVEHDYDHVCVNYKLSNDSLETEIYNKRVSDFGECSDFRNYENFQTIAKMETYSEKYINEHPDYDSDISSHGDYNKSQGEEGDPISHTRKEVKNIDLPEQKHSFTKDLTRDWKSIECDEVDIEDTDHQSPGIRDVVGLSGITTSSGAEMEDSRMEDCWTNSSENPNSSSVSVLNPSEYISVNLNRNNKEHNSEPLEVLDIGENINSLMPETFWSLMAEDNLKLDEYDWDINEEEVICDREDSFLEELENDGLETERDWEKEKARIEAFNRYYGSVEGEINEGRIHKVKFCLDPESCQYGEDSDGSEEEVSSVSEWNSPQSSSVRPEQSSNEHNHEPLEVSDIRENISNLEPKTVWSSSLLMDEDNLKLEKYGDDINGDDFHKISTMEICDEKEKLLEELKNVGQERMDWEQEQARIEAFKRYCKEPVGGGQNKATVRSHKVTLSLDQESSQYEEVDDDDDDDDDSSEQESNTEDEITFNNLKTEDQSESDEPKERCSCRLKVLPKGLQKPGQKLKEQHKSYRCLVLLKSALAVSLVTVVGVLSYWWATDSLDWIY